MHLPAPYVVASYLLTLVISVAGNKDRIKLTLRNLAGEHVRIWWREVRPIPGKVDEYRLVPQSAIPVRNSTQIQIDTFRGHQFVLRKTKSLDKFGEAVWRENEYGPQEEVIMTIGNSNEIVVVNRDFSLQHRDDAFFSREAVVTAISKCRSVGAQPLVVKSCIIGSIVHQFSNMRSTFQLEQTLREGIYNDLTNMSPKEELEKESLQTPEEPPAGWATDASEDANAATVAVEQCGTVPSAPPSLPPQQSQNGRCHSDEQHEEKEGSCLAIDPSTATLAEFDTDGHEDCAIWARIGECSNNPAFMRSTCKSACAREDAAQVPFVIKEEMYKSIHAVNRYRDCVAKNIQEQVHRLLSSITSERNAKLTYSDRFRNILCSHSPETSEPVASQTWIDGDGRELGAKLLFNTSAVSIQLLEGFVDDKECTAMVDDARNRLKPATVNEELQGKGLTSVSNSRRAQSAVVNGNWHDPNHPMARVQQRAINITNELIGYKLSYIGQEPLQVIQYDRPENHPQPQEYKHHCDGLCDGSPFLPGGRVATILIYCQVAEEGGGTTFANSRVFVQPKRLDAVLFSYKDPKTGLMDFHLTEHSGCPVLKGDKWVITQWLRDGVTREIDWTQYDPSGGRTLGR